MSGMVDFALSCAAGLGLVMGWRCGETMKGGLSDHGFMCRTDRDQWSHRDVYEGMTLYSSDEATDKKIVHLKSANFEEREMHANLVMITDFKPDSADSANEEARMSAGIG